MRLGAYRSEKINKACISILLSHHVCGAMIMMMMMMTCAKSKIELQNEVENSIAPSCFWDVDDVSSSAFGKTALLSSAVEGGSVPLVQKRRLQIGMCVCVCVCVCVFVIGRQAGRQAGREAEPKACPMRERERASIPI